jgi:hypothetical protein
MGQRTATSGTNFEPSFVQRVAGALSLVVSGRTPDWFGPLEPLAPVAPDAAVRGRAFDYPVAYNVSTRPKSNDNAAVDFKDLRLLADNYDILRLVIETRKDQLSGVPWNVVDKRTGETDSTADAIKAFLARPDGCHTFASWIRMLVEDVLVIDAPTLYIDRTGKIPVFEVVDGATIKPLLDEWGRRPKAPSPAYQQNLKGVAAINYTTDELIYEPRNPRSFKSYGYSPVEQIISTVNIGIRRVTQQLEHFRSGSIPEAIIGVPETWQPPQIDQFQKLWDELRMGNQEARAGAAFIPGGTQVHLTKTDSLIKNDFDEWLARIVCFAFSIPPSAFVKDMNRATAETALEQSKAEGLAPLMQWAKALLDDLIQNRIGATNYEFKWDFAALEDPKKKIERVVALKNAGIISVEYAQEMAGVEAHKVEVPAPVAAKTEPVEKLAKADTVDPDMTPEEIALSEVVHPFLASAAEKAVKGAELAISEGKALPSTLMTDADRKRFVRAVSPTISAKAVAGVYEGAAKVQEASVVDPDDVLAPAKIWAKNRAAWLVGMKWEDGKLIENPNAAYRIDASMRDALRSQVSNAIEKGISSVKLAESIRTHEAFSIARANNIARTEIAEAQEEGNMAYYRASGVVDRKRWSTAGGDTCPRCVAAQDEGVIPLEAVFVATNTQHAPAHGHCRCRVIPVVKEGAL